MRLCRLFGVFAADALLTLVAMLSIQAGGVEVSGACGSSPAETPLAHSAGRIYYRLDPDSSTVHVLTGSSGLFGFVGHEHVIAVPRFTGDVEIDSTDVTRFSFAIVAPADSLRVADQDEDSGTRRKIEGDMKAEVLETAQYPTIELHGLGYALSGGGAGRRPMGVSEGQLRVAVTLHGTKRDLDVPLRLELDHERLRARGKFSIRHSDFGMKRKKVAGVVNVAEKLEIVYDVVGRAVASPRP